jgi:hypothetical protein
MGAAPSLVVIRAGDLHLDSHEESAILSESGADEPDQQAAVAA